MDQSQSFKKRIKAFVLETGISIPRLEKMAGLKPRSIYNFLYDRSKNPKISTLISISKVIGCSVDDLINESSDQSTLEEFKNEVLKSEKKTLHWDVNLAVECLKIVNEYSVVQGYILDGEKAFLLCRKIYEYCLNNKLHTLDITFAKWLIDETMRK